MEYVQEQIVTLHDLADPDPEAPLSRTAVVVPMTHREHERLAAERTLSTLAELDPAKVVVPLRAPAAQLPQVRSWLDTFELPLTLLWCNGPEVEALLDEHGLDGDNGKGSDVWLAIGVATRDCEYVVCHDADATNYAPTHVPRLCAPLAAGFEFVKGYYARVENEALYGRLFRLFYVPLVRALTDDHDAPILDYLGAFRYALAGEFALTARLARRLRAQRTWGLEVGVLGDAFEHAGTSDTAQVDLGRHEHDHRSVGGPAGLQSMSREVGTALLRVVEEGGVTPEYETLPDRYRRTAEQLVEAYAADAAFNDLEYDRGREREQVEVYADAITPPGEDRRLPAWIDAPIDPETVRSASRAAISDAIEN